MGKVETHKQQVSRGDDVTISPIDGPPTKPHPVNPEEAGIPVECLDEIINENITLWHAMMTVTKLSVPITFSCMSQTFLIMYGMAIAGTFGTTPLGAASLAYSFVNASAFSIASGFCGALDTFLSHAYGKDPNSKMYGVHTQRAVICMLVLSIPVAASFAYMDVIMRLFGQDEGVTFYTVTFTRCALLGLLPMMLVEVAKRFYLSQHLTTPVMVATLLGTAVVNPVAVWLMTRGDDRGLGFEAIPLGWSAAMTFVFVSLVGYMIYTGKHRKNWEGVIDARALKNWKPMLRLGGLSISMLVGEWVVVELNNMAAGLTTPTQLAAFAITGQLALFGWNVLAGFFNSMPVFVGTCIGAGQPAKAKIFAEAGLMWCLIIGLIQATIMVVFGPLIGRLFSSDEEVLGMLQPIFITAAFFHVVDGLQSCSLGILRGCGMQGRGAVFVGLSYPIIGMPLGWIMCFYFDWGVKTLWLGPALGTFLVGLPLCLLTIRNLNWDVLEPHEEPIDPSELDE